MYLMGGVIMAEDKKALVLAALEGKPVDRVPVGFWFHFLDDEVKSDAFRAPELTEKLLAGEREYIETSQPDFVKIMTDGFFPYPNPQVANARSLRDFDGLAPLPDDSPWFTRQVAYAKELTSRYGDEIALFYNLFCAGTILKFMQPDPLHSDGFLASLIEEDAARAREVLGIISGDVAKLARRLIEEAGVTGIYFSLQNPNAKGFAKELYEKTLAPGERQVLETAQAASPYNILHICGYDGHRNDLSWYVDYPAAAVNWAVTVEGVSLSEGQKLFGGRTVLGGFGNLASSVLYRGTREDVTAETQRLLAGAGRQGVILGADCTVPRDIDRERFDWVRDAAR